MIVYIIRSSDALAHEGSDDVEDVFESLGEAQQQADKWNASPDVKRYCWYVETWEVK